VRQIDDVGQLGLEQPGVEGQVERDQGGKAFAEALVQVQPLGCGPAEDFQDRIVTPGRAVADAAQAPVRDG